MRVRSRLIKRFQTEALPPARGSFGGCWGLPGVDGREAGPGGDSVVLALNHGCLGTKVGGAHALAGGCPAPRLSQGNSPTRGTRPSGRVLRPATTTSFCTCACQAA